MTYSLKKKIDCFPEHLKSAHGGKKCWNLPNGAEKLDEHYNKLWSFLKSTLGSLLIHGAHEFVFLTRASIGSGAVTKPTFGKPLPHNTLIVTTKPMLSIFSF